MKCNQGENGITCFSSEHWLFPAAKITQWRFLFNFFLTTVLSQWDFSHGKFGLLFPGKASCDRVALPSLLCMLGDFSVSIIHRTLTWTTGSFTCAQMLISIRLHTGGVRTHVRESALKTDCGRKIPFRTGESNRRQRRAGPMLYQWATSPPPPPGNFGYDGNFIGFLRQIRDWPDEILWKFQQSSSSSSSIW